MKYFPPPCHALVKHQIYRDELNSNNVTQDNVFTVIVSERTVHCLYVAGLESNFFCICQLLSGVIPHASGDATCSTE